jgi:hypothetical protein
MCVCRVGGCDCVDVACVVYWVLLMKNRFYRRDGSLVPRTTQPPVPLIHACPRGSQTDTEYFVWVLFVSQVQWGSSSSGSCMYACVCVCVYYTHTHTFKTHKFGKRSLFLSCWRLIVTTQHLILCVEDFADLLFVSYIAHSWGDIIFTIAYHHEWAMWW